jgi:regulator of sigma E protease
MAYLFAILGLSVLIVVHELGHMWIARLSGMRVHTFSVGFGPALLRWRGRRTTYQLALIPLGGYVQIAGMNPVEPIAPDDPGSYNNKSALARVATIAAGPLTNYLLASFVMVAIMLAWGAPRWERLNLVGAVVEDLPAERAGIKTGDRIVAIDGHPMPGGDEILAYLRSAKGPIKVQVRREKKTFMLAVKPEPRKNSPGVRIGVGLGRKLAFSEISTGDALAKGLYYPIYESRRALSALGQVLAKLARGDVTDARQVGGPVEIVHQLSMSFKESTVVALIFLAMLSAYLGLFNLLPVPALDGGRLLFLFSAILLRRKVNQRFEQAVHTVGFLLLVGLLMLVTYCDVARRMGG